MNLQKNKIKKIHFVGIKGVGMTPLAIIAKEAGFEVSGSDVGSRFITDEELEEADIQPLVNFSPQHINEADLVIATGAHSGAQNVEVLEAVSKNIPVLNQGQALGAFQTGEILGKEFFGISVAGSHGKTTTTAIVATILKNNKLDPTYVIGTGSIPSLGLSGHFGHGKYFVAEADEYFSDVESDKTPKFLYQKPEIILVTNIDFDHPDVYPTIEELRSAFIQFTLNLKSDGVLVVCGDGDENRKFIKMVNCRKITYGSSPDNDYVLERVNFDQDKMFFWVKSSGRVLGEFSVKIFGEQNGRNCLGAIVVGLELGLSVEQIKKGLLSFSGTKRRSEFIGNLPNGGFLYDDYAHHPVEIKETLAAFRKSFPRHKIITIFQPHMYSRTKTLFNDFANSFSDADEVILTEIFPSFREPVDANFSSSLLASEIKKFSTNAMYFATASDVVKYVPSQNYPRNTIIITMGAGDIYKIGKELIKNNG